MAGKEVANLENLTIGLKDGKGPHEMCAEHWADRQLRGTRDVEDMLAVEFGEGTQDFRRALRDGQLN